MKYNLIQWMAFFFIYCIIGWIYESIEVSIRRRKLTNRGFMRGPMLPIYGFGAVVMLVIGIPLYSYPIAMFLAGIVVCTLLELATGEAMEAIFKVRYWDYTNSFMNFRGHICLVASLAWGFFTLALNYWMHNPVERFILGLPENILQYVVIVLLIYFVADYSLSFKTALDLRDILIAMEKVKEEVEHVEKRLDVVIAFAQQDKEVVRNIMQSRLEERILAAERVIEDIREVIEHNKQLSEEKAREISDEIAEIRVAAKILRHKLGEGTKEHGFLYRNMLNNNPSMASSKYSEALEELKKRLQSQRKQ